MRVSRMSLVIQSPRPLWLILNCFAVSLFAARGAAADKVDFDSQIAPIFAGHCIECHSGNKPKGGLVLSNSEGAAKGGESGEPYVPKDSSKSFLWERVFKNEMPPKHPLEAEQKAVLKRWIDEGAKWGTSPIDPFAVTTSKRAGRDWWSLQPLPAERSNNNRDFPYWLSLEPIQTRNLRDCNTTTSPSLMRVDVSTPFPSSSPSEPGTGPI